MKKSTSTFKLFLAVVLSMMTQLVFAQTSTLSTSGTFTYNGSSSGTFANNNGSGTVTFNLQNTNSYNVKITQIEGVTGTAGAQTCQVWYKATPINGAPGAISVANGWTMLSSGTFTGVANTTTTTTQVFLSNQSIIMPANTTWGFAVTAFSGTSTTTQRYHHIFLLQQ